MSRINTNVQALLAQRVLANNNQQLNKSLERLSTGFRINRGADDPAGLIASENLRSQKASITAAIGNAERADQVANIAEGGLQEVNSLLLEVQGLIGQSANDAGLSQEEKEANQLQINSILSTIDRIAEQTSFQGSKLLNGSFDFQVENRDAGVADLKINAAKLPYGGGEQEVQVAVTASAQHGALYLDAGGAALDLSAADASFTIEVAGAQGSREFSFSSGQTLTDIADQINTFTEVTGVQASTSGTGLVLKSSEFGSSEFVSVDVVDAGGQAGSVFLAQDDDENSAQITGTAFNAVTNPIRDDGQDVVATINGITANTNGKTAHIASEFLDVEVTLEDTEAQTNGVVDAFTITGGGAVFNLGPEVNISNQVSIGIGNVSTRNLGSEINGTLDTLRSGGDNNVVDGNLGDAQKVVNDAIKQVSSLRGRIGAFQKNVVGSTIRSLNVQFENTAAAESAIRDTDFATETAELTRSQILAQASSNILQLAKSQPQNVLGLLG